MSATSIGIVLIVLGILTLGTVLVVLLRRVSKLQKEKEALEKRVDEFRYAKIAYGGSLEHAHGEYITSGLLETIIKELVEGIVKTQNTSSYPSRQVNRFLDALSVLAVNEEIHLKSLDWVGGKLCNRLKEAGILDAVCDFRQENSKIIVTIGWPGKETREIGI